jgi:4-amino-4-deoxy-L-arabinose transferase-like glycosyltransferase
MKSASVLPRSAWAVFALALLVALPGNGSSRPLEAHEAFVARSAEEMVGDDGQWLIGRVGGEWRLEKPPMSYWLARTAHALLGGERVSELQARLPSILAAALLAILVFQITTCAFGDRRMGAVAALLWTTGSGFAAYSRNARPDMLYAALCGAFVYGLLRAARAGTGTRTGWAWALAGWGAAALAVLTKGPYLPAFILVGVLLGAWAGRRRPGAVELRAMHPLVGGALVLSVTAAYFLAVRASVPEAFEIWRSQMLDRVGGDRSPWLRPLEMYYVFAPLLLLLPWLLPLALALRWTWRERGGAAWVLASAVLATGLALSFSEGRHAYYVLPVLPFVHCLMGAGLVDWYDRTRASGRHGVHGRALAFHLWLIPAAAVFLGVSVVREPLTPAAPMAAALTGAVALGAGALAWRHRRSRPAHAFVGLAVGLAALQAGFATAAVGWSADRFTKAEFARELGRLVPPTVPVLGLGRDRATVIYYANRTILSTSKRRLEASLFEHPGALVVARRSLLEEGLLVGEVVLSEEAVDDGDPLVLVRPGPGRGRAAVEDEVPGLDEGTRKQPDDEDRIAEP